MLESTNMLSALMEDGSKHMHQPVMRSILQKRQKHISRPKDLGVNTTLL